MKERGICGLLSLCMSLPTKLSDFYIVRFAYVQVLLLVLLDLFDTVSDVFIALGQTQLDLIVLMSIALFLGTWQLFTEVALLFRGRKYITKMAFLQSYGDPKHCRHFAAIMAYSRCLSEDGIVMVVAVIKGEQITGLDRYWLGISAVFVLWALVQWLALLISVCNAARQRREEGTSAAAELWDSAIIFVILMVFLALWVNFILLYQRPAPAATLLESVFLYTAAVCIVLGALLSLGYGQTIISANNTNNLWWYGPWGRMPADVEEPEELQAQTYEELHRALEDVDDEGVCGLPGCCIPV